MDWKEMVTNKFLKEFLQKKSVQYIVGLLVGIPLLYFLYLNKFGFLELRSAFRHNWVLCVEYLAQGTLYGGQPFCEQGVILHLYGYALRSIFGTDGIQFSAAWMLFIFCILSVFLISSIIQKQTGKNYFWLIALFYIPVTYYLYGIGNTAVVLGIVFVLLGFRCILNDGRKWRILAGTYFALGVFSHATLLFLLTFVLLWLIFQYCTVSINEGKISISKNFERYKKIGEFALPFLILFFLFWLIWPNFWTYSSLLATKYVSSEKIGFFSTMIHRLWNVDLQFFTVIATAILTLGMMRWKSNHYHWIVLGGMGMTMTATWNITLQNIYRYMYTYGIIFILALFLFVEQYPKRKKLMLILTGIFLLIPGLFFIALDVQKFSFTRMVENPLYHLPEIEGKVLSEDIDKENFFQWLQKYDAPYEKKQLEVVYFPNEIDYYHYGGLSHYGLTPNITEWEQFLIRQYNERNEQISNKIDAGEYALIITKPPYKEHLHDIIKYKITNENSPFSQYCVVIVPTLHFFEGNGLKRVTLYFKDRAACQIMFNKVLDYYRETYAEICEQSALSAQFVEEALGTYLPDVKCENKNKEMIWKVIRWNQYRK